MNDPFLDPEFVKQVQDAMLQDAQATPVAEDIMAQMNMQPGIDQWRRVTFQVNDNVTGQMLAHMSFNVPKGDFLKSPEISFQLTVQKMAHPHDITFEYYTAPVDITCFGEETL